MPREIPQLLQEPVKVVSYSSNLRPQLGSCGGTGFGRRRSNTNDTSRRWMPSCRSRSIRRRASHRPPRSATEREVLGLCRRRLGHSGRSACSRTPISATPRWYRTPRSPPARRRPWQRLHGLARRSPVSDSGKQHDQQDRCKTGCAAMIARPASMSERSAFAGRQPSPLTNDQLRRNRHQSAGPLVRRSALRRGLHLPARPDQRDRNLHTTVTA